MTARWVVVLVVALGGWAHAAPASAQPPLVELLQRHGVVLGERGFEGAFDDAVTPSVPASAGSFAAPLALLAAGTEKERVAAAYTFGILAGRSAKNVAAGDLAAAVQALVPMIASDDRRMRVAGARVAGRICAVPLDTPAASVSQPPGLVEALFALFNRSGEIDQLAAMDALGLLRSSLAAASLSERYHFYRRAGRRALAGGALEALARIGDPSSVEIVKSLAADRWFDGKDPAALAAAFARERVLQDGSIAMLRQALDDPSRRIQARGYLVELGAAVP